MLKSKEIKEYKEVLFKKQQGKCLLCLLDLDEDIQKNHLDHSHDLKGINAGKCRGLLCNLCNVLEGIIRHKFLRSGLASKGVDMHDWIRRCVTYTEQDHSENRIHPMYLNDLVKQFSRMNKPEQKELLAELGYFEDGTKAFLVKTYRKLLRKKLTE